MIRSLGENADSVGKDAEGAHRTIYDVGWGTLIGRNFVAGMSRALGGLFLNLVILAIIGSFLVRYVWPQLEGTYQSILHASQIISRAGEGLTSNNSGQNVLPLFGETVRFDIQDLGKPGTETKSIELSPDQLEQLLFQNSDQQL